MKKQKKPTHRVYWDKLLADHWMVLTTRTGRNGAKYSARPSSAAVPHWLRQKAGTRPGFWVGQGPGRGMKTDLYQPKISKRERARVDSKNQSKRGRVSREKGA